MFLELTADTHEKEQQHDHHHHRAERRHGAGDPRSRTGADPVPRLMAVELRKMFDTRSGFWLMVSIAITGVLATGAGDPLRAGQRDDLRQLRAPRSASR